MLFQRAYSWKSFLNFRAFKKISVNKIKFLSYKFAIQDFLHFVSWFFSRVSIVYQPAGTWTQDLRAGGEKKKKGRIIKRVSLPGFGIRLKLPSFFVYSLGHWRRCGKKKGSDTRSWEGPTFLESLKMAFDFASLQR